MDDPFDCEFGCMPMDHGIEPDAASIDELAWPMQMAELDVKVGCPHGRSIHLSVARPYAFGTMTDTIRFKNERELRAAFKAMAEYLGVDVE